MYSTIMQSYLVILPFLSWALKNATNNTHISTQKYRSINKLDQLSAIQRNTDEPYPNLRKDPAGLMAVFISLSLARL